MTRRINRPDAPPLSSGSFLDTLTHGLAGGLQRLPAELREAHAAYLAGRQNPDGGFSGRAGRSDLYYTAFGLRGMAVLGTLAPPAARLAGDFLRSQLQGPASVVDFSSLLYAAHLVRAGGGPDVLSEGNPQWRDRVAAALDQFRSADGGYAKAAAAAAGSTYHTFLVALCSELIGRPLPDPQRVVAFVLGRRRDDGGFVEIAVMRRSGANPTAAAVGLLLMLDAGDHAVRSGCIEFLGGLQGFDGGLRANARAPASDLLSTFTGLWTLASLGGLGRIDLAAAGEFLAAVGRPGGGFRGGLWDDATDVEYTFYGLGAHALLALART